MPVFIRPSRLLLRDVSSSSTSTSSERTGWGLNVTSLLEEGSHSRGLLDHLLCTHIYAVALVVLIAAVVAFRLAIIARNKEKRTSSRSSKTSEQSPNSPGFSGRTKGQSGSGSCIKGGGEKGGISNAKKEGRPLLGDSERTSVARRAGGFGETTTLHAQLAHRKQQQQQQPQDQGTRHHRAFWAMVEDRSRGVSTNDGAGSGVHLSRDPAAASAEKDAGQPYRTPPPPSPLYSRLQATLEPNVRPQDRPIMEGADSWSGASALDPRAPLQADSIGDASSSTPAPGAVLAAAAQKMSIISLSSASGLMATGAHAVVAEAGGSGGSGSGLAPVRLGLTTTPHQSMVAPAHPVPSLASLSRDGFGFQDRRPAYAASIPPELDGGVASSRLSFIHQPNPDYTSANEGPGTESSESFSRYSSSSMSAESVIGDSYKGPSSPRSVPRRRSYNRMASLSSESEAVVGVGMSDGSGDQHQEDSRSYSPYPSHHFAPSSFPSTASPHLPPPPPGPENYGHDTTFFDQQPQEHYQQYPLPQHGHYQEVEGPSHHELEQGHGGGIGVHGEIVSMVDESGASWKRHTRVYGGGVCLACLANGGGFYGDNVPLEERRPR